MGFHPIWNWDYGITPVLKLGLRDYRTPPMGALIMITARLLLLFDVCRPSLPDTDSLRLSASTSGVNKSATPLSAHPVFLSHDQLIQIPTLMTSSCRSLWQCCRCAVCYDVDCRQWMGKSADWGWFPLGSKNWILCRDRQEPLSHSRWLWKFCGNFKSWI